MIFRDGKSIEEMISSARMEAEQMIANAEVKEDWCRQMLGIYEDTLRYECHVEIDLAGLTDEQKVKYWQEVKRRQQ